MSLKYLGLPRFGRCLTFSGMPKYPNMGAGRRWMSSGDKESRKKHIEDLAKYYPPALLESILSAESAVDPKHWEKRKLSQREFAPFYVDDYAKIDPFYDLPRHEWTDKSEPWQPVPKELVPKLESADDEFTSRAATGVNMTRLQQTKGLTPEFLRSLTVKFLVDKKVVNMTRMGKIRSHFSLAVVGNRDGLLGIGQGKDQQLPTTAQSRAFWDAIKNIRAVPRYEDRTIYGSVDHKFGAVVVKLRAGGEGSGLRVNHIVFEICKAAGIKDLVGNVYRSRNPMNVAKCTFEALTQKQTLIDEIAITRGKKLIDVSGTYYKI